MEPIAKQCKVYQVKRLVTLTATCHAIVLM